MDEKLKRENMQKEQFSEWGVGVGVKWYEWWLVTVKLMIIIIVIIIDHYPSSRVSLFKFSKFSSPQAARGIDPLTEILRTPLIVA